VGELTVNKEVDGCGSIIGMAQVNLDIGRNLV
jgi:hypothetical protein